MHRQVEKKLIQYTKGFILNLTTRQTRDNHSIINYKHNERTYFAK